METKYTCICGSDKFRVVEDLYWDCTVDGDGELFCKHDESFIRQIFCRECGAVKKNDFKVIEYK